MQFPTPVFALFILAVLPLWHALGHKPRSRAWASLGLSALFLGFAGQSALAVAVCFGLGAAAVSSRGASMGQWSFRASILVLLGPLAYFKYGAWFCSMAGLPPEFAWSQGTPFGLSFYTFSALSWLFCVREGSCPTSTVDSLAGSFFFPAITSGPVLRPKDCAVQLAQPVNPSLFSRAASPFLLGFFLKLAVSTRLGQIADPVFSDPSAQNFLSLAVAVHAYGGQLYADFAGYSLMAIGVGRALGVELPSNFEAPYFASSIAEFWRRWHISLSTFWRERIYFPLGGNRAGKARELANLMGVMLLCGLWHGAGLSFILWGALHGLMLCVQRVFSWTGAARLPKTLAFLLTFEAVTWTWLPFRLSEWSDLSTALSSMSLPPTAFEAPLALLCACFAAIGVEHAFKARLLGYGDALGRERPVLFVFLAALTALAIIEISPEGIPPFIYSSF